MYVAEANILPPSGMRVRVVNMEGQDYVSELSPDMKVDALKIKSLSKLLSNPADSMKASLYHKILLVRTGKILNEEKTLAQEGVSDNDELILLKKRLLPPRYEAKDSKEDNKRKITGDVVKKATSTLPVSKPVRTPLQTSSTPDFQSELRKILVSLIEASQRILCLNPEASKIFKQAEEMLKDSKEKPRMKKVDLSLLKQLTDMGFPESRAKKALLLNKMSVMSAMDWMIKHESDKDIDEPLSDPEDEESDSTTSESQTEGAVGGVESTDNSHTVTAPQVTNILHSLKAFRKREFKPSPRALQNLIEMGFEEKDAIDALRVGRNDQDTACDWLLGDRKTKPEEIEEGIDTCSPVFKAIMANPSVQLGLNNPRCLLAFLQMLESPLMMHQWLNDPETGPLLVQISRIYHSEKHSDTEQVSESSARKSVSPSQLSSHPSRNSSVNCSESTANSVRIGPPSSSSIVSGSRLPSSSNGASNISPVNSVTESSPVRTQQSTTRSRPERDAGTPVSMSRSSSGKSKSDSKSKGR